MPPSNKIRVALMWRGAKIGATSFGLVGFVGGISVCVAYHLPFPPIAVTEIGLLLGGCLGAVAGYVWCYPAGRGTLRGSFLGSGLGLLPAGLQHGNLSITIWLACLMLGAVLGYQASCTPSQIRTSDWKLR